MPLRHYARCWRDSDTRYAPYCRLRFLMPFRRVLRYAILICHAASPLIFFAAPPLRLFFLLLFSLTPPPFAAADCRSATRVMLPCFDGLPRCLAPPVFFFFLMFSCRMPCYAIYASLRPALPRYLFSLFAKISWRADAIFAEAAISPREKAQDVFSLFYVIRHAGCRVMMFSCFRRCCLISPFSPLRHFSLPPAATACSCCDVMIRYFLYFATMIRERARYWFTPAASRASGGGCAPRFMPAARLCAYKEDERHHVCAHGMRGGTRGVTRDGKSMRVAAALFACAACKCRRLTRVMLTDSPHDHAARRVPL